MGGNALRKCRHCGKEAHTEDELELFKKHSQCKHGRDNLCNVCTQVQNNKQPAHKIKTWKTDHQVRTRYHCTLAEYEERMASSSCCECCGKESDLVYDHCHDTMKFRGVLCRGCNRSIGQLGDTLESVERALNYMRKHYEH